MNKVWVITEEHNDYDQHGEYFCCVFKNKPTHQQCLDFLLEKGYIQHFYSKKHQDKMAAFLMNGGGRYESDSVWYWLEEVELK